MLVDTTPEEFTEDYLMEMRASQPVPDKEEEEEAESENRLTLDATQQVSMDRKSVVSTGDRIASSC